MRALSYIPIAALLLILIAVQAQDAQEPNLVTLASLRDSHRPLLLFAPSSNQDLQTQLHSLSQFNEELKQRDVIVVPLLLDRASISDSHAVSPLPTGFLSLSEQTTLRLRLHITPNTVTVVLIGKDGGEKFRSSAPVSPEKLFQIIDAMPMRQAEMRSQAKL